MDIRRASQIRDGFHTDTKEPTGFVNQTDSTLSFDNGTRTFTITPASTLFKYYCQGVFYYKAAAESIVISNTEGIHYIYYNNETLSETTTFSVDLITTYSLVSIIYWDATNSQQIYHGDERHGPTMDGMTHYNMHITKGAAYVSGLALGDFTADGDGSSAAHAQLSCANGVILDEDIFTTITDGSPQDISTILQAPVYYKDGASGYWRRDAATNFPVKSFSGGSGRLAWNQNNGGTWGQVEVGQLDYVLAHIYAINDINTPIISVQGQATYGNINAARDGAETEINNLSTDGLPFAEAVAIGSVIFQTSTGYGNSVKARVRTTEAGDNYIDFRRSQGISAGNPFGLPDVSGLEVVSVKFAGAKGDGVTDDYTAINNAITAIGADEQTLYFGPGTYYIGTSITTPANITVQFDRGAIVQDNADAAITFTINGNLIAGTHQIFNFTGAGSGAAFAADSVQECGGYRPEWWGAARDGTTDDAAAFQDAIDVIGRATGAITKGRLLLEEGTYLIGTQIEIEDQRIHILGKPGTDIKWDGNNTTSVFRVVDSETCVFEWMSILGKIGSEPKAAIFFDSPVLGTIGVNGYCQVTNVSIGRRNGDAKDSFPLQNGIYIGGAVSGNNDKFYIDKVNIHDCSDKGIWIENDQSIWGHISNVILNDCDFGIHTGANTQLENACFNRNGVDLYAFRDITVTVDGFNSEHAGLPISTSQGASVYIRGGKILLHSELTTSVWASIVASNYFHLVDLQVIESGVASTYIDVNGGSSTLVHITIKDCRLPNMSDGSGINLVDLNGTTLGGYVDIDCGDYVFKQFLHHSWPYDPASLNDGVGANSEITGATLADITAGDMVVTSFTQDLAGVLLCGTAYANQKLSWNFQNETGGVVDLASGYLRWRKIHPNQIKVTATAAYDMPLTADGAGQTTTISCPGADYGDFVVFGVNLSAYRYLQHAAYVSSPGIVSVRIQNESSGPTDPGSATLKVGILKENWEYIAAKIFDPSNLADGAGETTTIAVEGANIGDSVVASFSHDLQGILMCPYVSAADTVSVRFQNETGAAVNLSSGTLRVMVQPGR